MWPTIRCCGPDGEALEVPAADHRLPRGRLGEAAVVARSPRRRGTAGWSSRRSRSARRRARARRRRRRGTPRGRACRARPGRRCRRRVPGALGEVADGQRPGRVRAAEERLDVAAGDVGEVLAPLVASAAGRRRRRRAAATSTAHPTRRRPRRPGPRGRCRPSRRSGRRPWGRRRRRRAASTARSRTAAGAARGTRRPRCCVTTRALGAPDQVVVGEAGRGGCGTALPGAERDRVQPALGVGQLDPLPRAQRPPPAPGPGGRRTRSRSSSAPCDGCVSDRGGGTSSCDESGCADRGRSWARSLDVGSGPGCG